MLYFDWYFFELKSGNASSIPIIAPLALSFIYLIWYLTGVVLAYQDLKPIADGSAGFTPLKLYSLSVFTYSVIFSSSKILFLATILFSFDTLVLLLKKWIGYNNK